MIKIDKGVPIRPPRRPPGRRALYPWADMEVGDSFAVHASTTAEAQRRAAGLRTIACRHRPKRYTIRTLDGEVRCWRVE